jgi:hypothetical protein
MDLCTVPLFLTSFESFDCSLKFRTKLTWFHVFLELLKISKLLAETEVQVRLRNS